MYPWLTARCPAGQYLLGFDTRIPETIQCRPCPPGWAGLNGLYCERCGPLEEPYFLDRSSCVCRPPAVMNSSGVCVCPDGYQRGNGSCVPCATNTYGTDGLCRACGAGNYSGPGATRCEAWMEGKYRLSGQATCQGCAAGWFAPVPTQAVCVQCNASCDLGLYRSGACPGDGLLSVCTVCPGGLPSNARWSSNASACTFQCLSGFFHTGGGCQRCNTSRVCGAGWQYTPCTAVADSHCDKACVDANKPAFHSHWETGGFCLWACDAGYTLQVWDYIMFTLRECAPTG